MKAFDTNFEIEKNKKTGAKPVWILKCPFASGTLYLSDRIITVAGWGTGPTTKPWIARWGEIDEDITDAMGSPQVSDYECDMIVDPNEATDIHDLLWSENVETIDCELYLWFQGLDASTNPPVLMWTGNIIDFERAGELLYNVRLADESLRIDKYPGRILSLADYGNAHLNDVGYQMSIIYGSVEKVPALRLVQMIRTTLTESLDRVDTSFTVADASLLTSSSLIVIDSEEILITGLTDNTVTSCERGHNSTFAGDIVLAYYEAGINWCGLAAAPNGDVYAVGGYTGTLSDIYKRTAGAGDFVQNDQTHRYWFAIAAAPNGNIYATPYHATSSDIYMQTAGTGPFAAVETTGRPWRCLTVAPNGNVYAGTGSGDIYMQTAGAGAFNALSQTSRTWLSLCAAPNGDIYACTVNQVYKRSLGAGDFNSLAQAIDNISGITAAPNGDVFLCVENDIDGDVYKQTGGTGDFAAMGKTSKDYHGICIAANGDLYLASLGDGDIWIIAGTAAVHNSGASIDSPVTTVSLFADHPVKAIDMVYGVNADDGSLEDITAACTLYTGQGGANDLAGYEGMAVVTCHSSDISPLIDSFVISGQGYQDDGAALIERPDLIMEHFLYTYASWPVADFVHTEAATAFVADSYAFSAVINTRKKLRAWLAKMAFECRCWFRFALGQAYLLYRPDTLISDKTIPAVMIGANEDYTTTMRVSRTPLDEIVNKISLCYQRDWTQKGEGAGAYKAVVTVTNSGSITAYGEKEKPELFMFDFVTGATMAADLAAFYLARYKDRKKKVSMTLFLDNAELEFADATTITPLSSLLGEARKVNIAPGDRDTNYKITLTVREY